MWDWQVFYLTVLHSVTGYSTVSQLLIHLKPDNFHTLKTEQRELRVQTKVLTNSTVFPENGMKPHF